MTKFLPYILGASVLIGSIIYVIHWGDAREKHGREMQRLIDIQTRPESSGVVHGTPIITHPPAETTNIHAIKPAEYHALMVKTHTLEEQLAEYKSEYSSLLNSYDSMRVPRSHYFVHGDSTSDEVTHIPIDGWSIVHHSARFLQTDTIFISRYLDKISDEPSKFWLDGNFALNKFGAGLTVGYDHLGLGVSKVGDVTTGWLTFHVGG